MSAIVPQMLAIVTNVLAFVPLLFHFSRKICSTSEIGADSLFVQYTAILTQKSFLLVNMDANFVKFTT